MKFSISDVISSDMLDEMHKKLNELEMVDSCMLAVINDVWDQESVSMSWLLEQIVPCTDEQTFVVTRDYTLAHSLDTVYGKWPEQLGNGFYVESEYLL
jgi:hypothetical protein